MDPERWRQIEELYQSAVDSEVAERATLLANADPAVRREVESLLAQPTAHTPLDRSAFSALLYRRPDLQVGRPSRNAETHIRKREAELTQKKRRAAP